MTKATPHPSYLPALTDEQLDKRLQIKAERVEHSYDGYVAEINRRSSERYAKASIRLAWIVALATIVNAAAAIAAAWAAITVANQK